MITHVMVPYSDVIHLLDTLLGQRHGSWRLICQVVFYIIGAEMTSELNHETSNICGPLSIDHLDIFQFPSPNAVIPPPTYLGPPLSFVPKMVMISRGTWGKLPP